MVLLDPTIEVGMVPMLDCCAQHFPDRARIGVVPVGGPLLRCLFSDRQSTLKKPLLPIVIDCALQIAPAAFHL